MLIMNASEVPWIDEAGYWRKRLFVGNDPDDYIDLAVGARLKTDGSLKFEPMVTPSAVVPDAASALALSVEYDTLSAAKQVCDEVATATKMEFINPLKSIK